MSDPRFVEAARWEVIHGDCNDVLPTIGAVDAVVTDPPYGMGLTHGSRARTPKQKDGHLWGKDWGKISGDDVPFNPLPILGLGVPVVIWGANHYCDQLPPGNRWLVWHKETPDDMSYSDCELAWTSLGGGGVHFKGILWSGFRRRVEVREHYHPTQKPVELMRWSIRQLALAPDSLILDLYCGSGSTGVAAVLEGHRFIGIERELQYVEIARRRIADAAAQGNLFTSASAPKEER